jgi:hypothetical protein
VDGITWPRISLEACSFEQRSESLFAYSKAAPS